jgi:hypothetical protein
MERRVQRCHTQTDFTIAKLNLVDFAGVERLKKAGTDTGSLMRREACVINKSLSFLEQVRSFEFTICSLDCTMNDSP